MRGRFRDNIRVDIRLIQYAEPLASEVEALHPRQRLIMLGKTIPSEFTTSLDRQGHAEVVFSSTVDDALFRVDTDFVCTAQPERGECLNEEANSSCRHNLAMHRHCCRSLLVLDLAARWTRTQGQTDWIEILTSPAPAYLPWKIFTITCIIAFVLTMVGLIAKTRK